MGWVGRFARSSIGSKYLMAGTGLALSLFLVGHIAGNLLVFAGPDALNEYAAALRKLPLGLLWVARIGLLVVFLCHLATAIRLNRQNRAARPIRYQMGATYQASLASRSMIYTGMVIFGFLIYHLLHFTFLKVGPTDYSVDAAGRHDVYAMVIKSFQNPALALSYVFAMAAMGLHLSHGLSSLFQSLGLNHPKYNKLWRCGGPALAWLLAAAFSSVPLSILFGFVGK